MTQTLKRSFKVNLPFKVVNKFTMVLYFTESQRYIKLHLVFVNEIFRTVTNIQAVMK